MKNILMKPSHYKMFRLFLHRSEATWRDCRSSVIVPSWGECIARSDVCYGQQTASQIAYTCLRSNFPGLALKWQQSEMKLLDSRVPQVYNGLYSGPLYYLDIKSAFAQLYKHLFLHSRFPFKSQKYSLQPVAEQLWDMKVARNAVVGQCRSTQNKWATRHKVWYTPKHNKFLSPTLWAQLTGILNQVAVQMLEYGAVWVNTDGYLFTKRHHWIAGKRFLTNQGIAFGEGQGQGYIKSLQNIRVEGCKHLEATDVAKEPKYHIETSTIDFLAEWRKNRERSI